MVNTYSYFKIKKNFNEFRHFISGYTPETQIITDVRRSKHGFIFNKFYQ